MNTHSYLGFDPGGAGAFGWCLASGSEDLPLTVVAHGIVNHSKQAVDKAVSEANQDEPAAVGIDAPLFWRADGDRVVDSALRQKVVALGGHGGTVNHVNSLRGACLVQGMIIATLLRRKWPELRLTESHPKAMLWMLKIAGLGMPVEEITLATLNQFFIGGDLIEVSDHERDAALGALSAWAMANKAEGWNNLYPQEKDPISPLDPPPEYWMPDII